MSTANGEAVENPLHVLGIVDSQSARSSLAYDVYHRLQAEIEYLSTDLADLTSSSDRKVRAQTWRDRVVKYKEVRLRVDMFAELLDIRKENLINALAALQEQVKKSLEQIDIQPLLEGFSAD